MKKEVFPQTITNYRTPQEQDLILRTLMDEDMAKSCKTLGLSFNELILETAKKKYRQLVKSTHENGNFDDEEFIKIVDAYQKIENHFNPKIRALNKEKILDIRKKLIILNFVETSEKNLKLTQGIMKDYIKILSNGVSLWKKINTQTNEKIIKIKFINILKKISKENNFIDISNLQQSIKQVRIDIKNKKKYAKEQKVFLKKQEKEAQKRHEERKEFIEEVIRKVLQEEDPKKQDEMLKSLENYIQKGLAIEGSATLFCLPEYKPKTNNPLLE